ncbi:hypothetical protein [Herbaspirillum rubrisubalbicans]|uniref:hypothetical protein n=1 Tax=Herbaspirillum rubrisubalbicans TaxID=80842 RepID=UPI000376B076|nr:hypothetical protein [Herbaspirillum rubrisubalbicans]
MSSLKLHEKVIFEKLFDRGGFVLNFVDRTFAEFFREHNIDIDSEKYRTRGTSKMKRLRSFWEQEADEKVGQVLQALLDYAKVIEQVDGVDEKQANAVIERLTGKVQKEAHASTSGATLNEFLNQKFDGVELNRLNIDPQLSAAVSQRITEIRKCLSADIPLATIFLCGSTLEGLLLDLAARNARTFNESKAAFRNKETVRPLHEWPLESLINSAHETGFISLDVKKYSHALKDFRNYIHPRQQAVHGFNPDRHTAQISWQVLLAAIADLAKRRSTSRSL